MRIIDMIIAKIIRDLTMKYDRPALTMQPQAEGQRKQPEQLAVLCGRRG